MHGTVIDFSAAGLRLDVCRSPFGLSLQPWMFWCAREERVAGAPRNTRGWNLFAVRKLVDWKLSKLRQKNWQK